MADITKLVTVIVFQVIVEALKGSAYKTNYGDILHV